MANFEFLVDLIKAEEKDGERFFYGIASTEDIDSDGAIVEATGLKKSAAWYLKHGIIDWDHKSQIDSDPASIVGKPLDIHWDDQNRAHIKGKLYKGVKKADDIFDLIQAGANLGLSVGGKILEQHKVYDPNLLKTVTRITKVFMNHIAITPFPANGGTSTAIAPYADFFKSLSAGSSYSDDMLSAHEKTETAKMEELTKMMQATGNPPQEGTGGVKQGGSSIAKEDLERELKIITYGAPKNKKTKIQLNKSVTIEVNEEGDTLLIKTNSGEESLQDEALIKSTDTTKMNIAEGYMSLLKAMSEKSKEAYDVDAFMKSKNLDRFERRIIKRHLFKKMSELIEQESLIKCDKNLEPSLKAVTHRDHGINSEPRGYEKQGVIYGAQEDPSFIPKPEVSTATGKQIKNLLDSDVMGNIRKEADMFSPTELDDMDDILREQDYDSLTDKQLEERYTMIRLSYGRPAVSHTQFKALLENNRYSVLGIVRRYDQMIQAQFKNAMMDTINILTSKMDNDNQSKHVLDGTKERINDYNDR